MKAKDRCLLSIQTIVNKYADMEKIEEVFSRLNIKTPYEGTVSADMFERVLIKSHGISRSRAINITKRLLEKKIVLEKILPLVAHKDLSEIEFNRFIRNINNYIYLRLFEPNVPTIQLRESDLKVLNRLEVSEIIKFKAWLASESLIPSDLFERRLYLIFTKKITAITTETLSQHLIDSDEDTLNTYLLKHYHISLNSIKEIRIKFNESEETTILLLNLWCAIGLSQTDFILFVKGLDSQTMNSFIIANATLPKEITDEDRRNYIIISDNLTKEGKELLKNTEVNLIEEAISAHRKS